MPKEVDHSARRRELADAACRVIARNGLGGTTLADVAEESGWSIGSIRHYFPNKDELIASALWRVGNASMSGSGPHRRRNDDERPRIAATECSRWTPTGATRPWSTWPSWRRRRSCPRSPAPPRAPRTAAEPLAARSPCDPGRRVAGQPGRRGRGSAPAGATRRAAPAAGDHPRQTSATSALAVLDDHLSALAVPSAGGHLVPDSAVQVEVVAPGLAGGGVADVGVQRMAVVGELVRAVGTGDRGDLAGQAELAWCCRSPAASTPRSPRCSWTWSAYPGRMSRA